VADEATLHFDGKAETAKKRIQKLKNAGLITERPRQTFEPSILFLPKKALAFLDEQGLLRDYPQLGRSSLEKRAQVSTQTLRHELDVMNVKTALVRAVSKTDRFRIAQFSTWPLLYQFTINRRAIDPREVGEITVKPDGFIRIHEVEPHGGLSEHILYLEVDRSTESQKVLGDKALAYLEHYNSGGLAKRFGATTSEFRQYPFRALIVLPNTTRRDNTVKRLLANKPPSLTQTWLTTSPEILTDPLGEIWTLPKDWRDGDRDIRHHLV